MIERIEELNETKEWSRDLLHPTEEGLCSLLALYGVSDAVAVGLLDTSHGADDIRWNYIIDKQYVLRLTNAPEMTEARLDDLNRLIARYGAFGLHCPAFLRGTDGRFFHPWGELTAYLSEYVDLPIAEEADLTETEKTALRQEICLSIAGFMEQYKGVDLIPTMGMYSLFDLSPYDVPEGFDEKQWNLNNLTAALGKAGAEDLAHRLETWNETVRARLLSVYQELPRCVTQADEGFTNVLLDEKKHLKGLIDFNLSGTDVCVNLIANNAILDLDVPSVPSDKPFDPQAELEKALAGYRENAGRMLTVYRASEAERDALADYAWIALVCQYPNASACIRRIEKEETRASALGLLEALVTLDRSRVYV